MVDKALITDFSVCHAHSHTPTHTLPHAHHTLPHAHTHTHTHTHAVATVVVCSASSAQGTRSQSSSLTSPSLLVSARSAQTPSDLGHPADTRAYPNPLLSTLYSISVDRIVFFLLLHWYTMLILVSTCTNSYARIEGD